MSKAPLALIGRLLLLPTAAALLGAAKFDPVENERVRQDLMNYQEVSIIALIANPAPFDGKRVRVSGYLTLRFEDAGLHFDRAAYEAGVRKNALRIEPPKWLGSEEEARRSDHYATVFATFHARDEVMGDHDIYSGTLDDVRRLRPAVTNADFERYMLQNSNTVLRQAMPRGLTIFFGLLIAFSLLARLRIWRRPRP